MNGNAKARSIREIRNCGCTSRRQLLLPEVTIVTSDPNRAACEHSADLAEDVQRTAGAIALFTLF
jgi:hypothetical protein